ncbi:hypothetical protein [Dysgonomonas sp. HGC4]|uniref:hypothetical protein n=1 Tax=Dysgonomonas sp. HGC4 TaxID=1658009 RepID=UPI00067FC466|nr:hypothetical protein [Dysgonomonas sp. HGC4]MBD8347670.1 hypothetical protein [Dysgonomonas sp. HGC4]
MKKEEENTDIQIVFDGFAQTLDEIKDTIKKNPQSALTADLLNKIQNTIDQAKEGITAKDLEKFGKELTDSIKELQKEGDKSVSLSMNQKVAEINELVRQPSIVINRYSIDFKSSKIFIAIIFLSLGLFCSLFGNYNQYQENCKLTDNDLKYRFVKMKNGILPNEITRLENFFYYSDSAYVVNNIRKSVIDYEHRLQEHARKQELKKQNEETIQKLDKEIEELDVK